MTWADRFVRRWPMWLRRLVVEFAWIRFRVRIPTTTERRKDGGAS